MGIFHSDVTPENRRAGFSLWVQILIALSLVLLLAHAFHYKFITDDAFISFRYADNLAHGSGLVFNPGQERVEGYTNFLWVLLLAFFRVPGLKPESVSITLSLLATVGLWAIMVAYVVKFRPESGNEWIPLVPLSLLGATRSVAVWSTGGLETRLFELLILAGVFRLLLEIETLRRGEEAPRPWSFLLFALATLTRPDGLLMSSAAYAAAGSALLRVPRRTLWRWAAGASAYLFLVGGHFLFRQLYYGRWLPNTYYAKVGGAWWDMGFRYAAAFILEYGAYFWLPLIAAAFLFHFRKHSLHVPLVFCAVILPHALYVMAIGGDHFEFRPFDVYFPLIFLLIYDGLRALSRRFWISLAAAAYLVLLLIGLVWIPWQFHVKFPGEYLPGFPGLAGEDPLQVHRAEAYLDPSGDPLMAFPGYPSLREAYTGRLLKLTASFVGVRQEEHKLFAQTAIADGKLLKGEIGRGWLPPDAYVALSCVGAIPYYSHLRTLDRLGLTDAVVAGSGFQMPQRIMAHEKNATLDYARQRGVDLWALDSVHLILPVTHPRFMYWYQTALGLPLTVYASPVEPGRVMLVLLPKGYEATAARFPKLSLSPLKDPAVSGRIAADARSAFLERVRTIPDDPEGWYGLAFWCGAAGLWDEAERAYLHLLSLRSDSLPALAGLSRIYRQKGDGEQARAYSDRALRKALQRGNAALLDTVTQFLGSR